MKSNEVVFFERWKMGRRNWERVPSLKLVAYDWHQRGP